MSQLIERWHHEHVFSTNRVSDLYEFLIFDGTIKPEAPVAKDVLSKSMQTSVKQIMVAQFCSRKLLTVNSTYK